MRVRVARGLTGRSQDRETGATGSPCTLRFSRFDGILTKSTKIQFLLIDQSPYIALDRSFTVLKSHTRNAQGNAEMGTQSARRISSGGRPSRTCLIVRRETSRKQPKTREGNTASRAAGA